MPKSDIAGGVVVGPENKILVVNQHGDSWSLPKGRLEGQEDEVAAAKREIYEESGIKEESLELVEKLGSYERTRIGQGGIGEVKGDIRVIDMYLFKTKQSKLAPIDPENPAARWVEADRVSELLTHQKDKEFFETVKNKVIC